MRLILAANTLENPGFEAFVSDCTAAYPDAAVLVCGDLLNVFPEPGEDIAGSIAYELYGEPVREELNRLHAQNFADAQRSPLVCILHQLFLDPGPQRARAAAIAAARYEKIFAKLTAARRHAPLLFIPGNMDYPQVAARLLRHAPDIAMLDGTKALLGGLLLGGLGGIPSSAQPLHGIAPISPYELSDAAYEAQMQAIWGAEVVLSHLSPSESPALQDFVRRSPVRLLICRAPFMLQRAGNCRGRSQLSWEAGKMIVAVRPFDYPRNEAYMVDLEAGGNAAPTVHIYSWEASRAQQDAARAQSRAPC
jgi:hypothetical protein